MKHFLATLEYDGTEFAGWQKQPGQRTVQGELEKVLREVAGIEVATIAAGRTDTGVHAVGQAASFSLPGWKSGLDVLVTALNAKLPLDVSVTGMKGVSAGFNARRRAVSRLYRYAFLLAPVRSPLLERYAFRVEKRLNIPLMRRVAALFRGVHDFTAFSRGTDGEKWPSRKVNRCSLTRSGRYLLLDVEAGGFLRHMVRHMAGAILGAGLGYVDISSVRQALTGGSRKPTVPMCPANGLALISVRFSGGNKPLNMAFSWPPGRVK